MELLEFELRWDSEGPEDLLLTTRGVATPDGIGAYRRAINSDERLQPGLFMLIDHRELDWSKMSTNEIRVESTLFPRDAVRLGAATMAVVMGSTVDFGLMRMLHGQIPGELELEAAIFYSIGEARAWLARRRVEPTAPPDAAVLHVVPGIS